MNPGPLDRSHESDGLTAAAGRRQKGRNWTHFRDKSGRWRSAKRHGPGKKSGAAKRSKGRTFRLKFSVPRRLRFRENGDALKMAGKLKKVLQYGILVALGNW